MKKRNEPVAPVGLSPALRRYLYATAAVTGASIMIVEILGAKMLAPYVGTSHFVWTAQITVALVALAVGYYLGGLLADRSQRLGPLYGAVLVAGLYLCVITLAIRPVAFWCLGFRLAMGSLLASLLLFFVPLVLLAMVGPFFVRVLTESVAGVGGNVGRLTAVGTLGSVGGTLLIGYVLIPLAPNSFTLYGTAAGLLMVAGGYFVVWERRSRNLPAVAMGIAAGLALGFLGFRADVRLQSGDVVELFRGNSNFGILQVIEQKESAYRYFLNDYLVQNTYDPVRKQSLSMFTYLLHDLAQAYTPAIRTALCIGLGVGIVPTQLAAEGVTVDVVEINPAVVRVAREFFDCPVERFRVALGDARHFLLQGTNRYDTIILDAFLGDSSPVHLMTREAFASMRQRLTPEGTLVINCFVDFIPRKDFFGTSLHQTLRQVFRHVRVHSAGTGNVFYVASDRDDFRPLRQPDFQKMHPAVRHAARAAFETLVEPDPKRGLVLSDDFNPVEYYDAANREEIRRHLADSMRR